MKEGISTRKINFGAGPAALPAEVLKEASEAVLDYNGSGLSILELPHRGKLFQAILEECNDRVRRLCGLNDQYEVLWLHGGARLQFCMIPMNFLGKEASAGFIDSGHWSAEAIKYAAHYGTTKVLSSSKETGYDRLPPFPDTVPGDLSYLHLTTNNTIYGTQWDGLPDAGVPLVADMSSDVLSRPRDYASCGLFYAVSQKNLGTVGATLVVIRGDMLDRISKDLPPMLDYRAHVKQHSVLSTAPVFPIYSALLMLRFTERKTIQTIEKESIRKAALLYEEVDRNGLFSGTVSNKDHRSRMNVCFRGNNSEIEKGFYDFCNRNNITGLEGHRTVGGFRASLYNAVTIPEVEKLVAVMQEFEANHQKS